MNEENKYLPHIYWSTKLNKNPTKAQFIIYVPKCSLKLISKYVTAVFKILFHEIESYNDQSQCFPG